MVSSTTIDSLKNRSRSGWLCTVFVNAGGKRPGFVHQSTRENERDRFDAVVCEAPILLAAVCAFSVNQTDRCGVCQGTDGNLSCIFSTEKCPVVMKRGRQVEIVSNLRPKSSWGEVRQVGSPRSLLSEPSAYLPLPPRTAKTNCKRA